MIILIIKLYQNNSNNKYVNKDITLISTLESVSFRHDVDILEPTIILDGWLEPYFKLVNYLYIERYGRYYYVTGIKALTGQRVEISLQCDELMSWKDIFLNLPATIGRQSNIFDTYLKDNEFLVEGYSRVQTMNFPYGLNNQECYLLMTNGSSIIENGGDENVS